MPTKSQKRASADQDGNGASYKVQGDCAPKELYRLWQEIDTICKSSMPDDVMNALCDAQSALERELIGTPSVDQFDLAAKLRFTAQILGDKHNDYDIEDQLFDCLAPDMAQLRARSKQPASRPVVRLCK